MPFFARKGAACLAASVFSVAFGASVFSQQIERTRIGTLACDISAGLSAIVAARRPVTCIFKPAHASLPREVYSGAITKVSRDLSANGGEAVWSVVTIAGRAKGALIGTYRSEASGMVGGINRAVVLQSAATSDQGDNLATSVVGLELQPAR